MTALEWFDLSVPLLGLAIVAAAPKLRRLPPPSTEPVPYKVTFGHYGAVFFTRLRPTGRWKLSSGPHNAGLVLHVQHRGWIFHEWVDEDHILWRAPEGEVVNACSRADETPPGFVQMVRAERAVERAWARRPL